MNIVLWPTTSSSSRTPDQYAPHSGDAARICMALCALAYTNGKGWLGHNRNRVGRLPPSRLTSGCSAHRGATGVGESGQADPFRREFGVYRTSHILVGG